MKAHLIYPGSFSPPTYGHFAIVKRAAAITKNLTIICSTNDSKNKALFTPKECTKLWRAYDLPANTFVMTLDETITQIDPKNVIMVRGIRNEHDAEDEKKVMFFNHEHFGIKNFLYLISDCKWSNVSSTAARKAAREFRIDILENMLAPKIITALMQKTQATQNP